MSKYDLIPCKHVQHISNSDCYLAHARLAIEEKMVRGLIRGLKAEGWTPVSTFDGEEHVNSTTETATLDAVFSVDDSTITFEKNGIRHGVAIVLGNGVDCISNYGMARDESDGWNAAIERITDELYERHQD